MHERSALHFAVEKVANIINKDSPSPATAHLQDSASVVIDAEIVGEAEQSGASTTDDDALLVSQRIINLLLENGASALLQDSEGQSALVLSMSLSNDSVGAATAVDADSALATLATLTEQLARCAHEYPHIPAMAKARGVTEDTSLHYAVGMGSAHLVRLLLAAGVPLTCCDAGGSTPLHIAPALLLTGIVYSHSRPE